MEFMNKDNKQPWILSGYELFSKEGQKGLKVEVIARMVGKNKSSFYHHFADLETFTALLLKYHLEQTEIIIAKERECISVVPDLLHILVAHKQDLLFNRQLRVNRNVPHFKKCFEKTNTKSAEAILGIWAEALGLKDNSSLARIVLNLSLENFFLQITEETLTYEWLENYVQDLQHMVKQFEKNNVQIAR
jgi:AcrR family transcriptional regulator